MANNSVVTQEVLQNTIENYHENFVYPYLNGATHAGFTPVGTVISYFGETAPEYFLVCDGTEYAKSDYPQLADLLLNLTDPTPYEGSDANHFKVPDLRGEFLRGTGTNSHSNQGNGASVGTHQDGTQHFTQTKDPDGNAYMGWGNKNATQLNRDSTINDPLLGNAYLAARDKNTSWIEGYFTSRPTNTSVLYCIAYKNIYIDLALDSFPLGISNPTDGQALVWNGTEGRWKNAGILHEYSTDEKVVGTWIDGKPLYEATIVSDPITITSNARTWTIINDTFAVNHNVKDCISISAFGFKNTEFIKIPQTDYVWNGQEMAGNGILDIFWSSHLTNKPFRLLTHAGTWVSGMIITFTIQYTKTTD